MSESRERGTPPAAASREASPCLFQALPLRSWASREAFVQPSRALAWWAGQGQRAAPAAPTQRPTSSYLGRTWAASRGTEEHGGWPKGSECVSASPAAGG